MFQTRNQDDEKIETYSSKRKDRSAGFIHKQKNYPPGGFSVGLTFFDY